MLRFAQLVVGAIGVGLLFGDLFLQQLQLLAQAAFEFPRGDLLLVQFAPASLQFLIERGDIGGKNFTDRIGRAGGAHGCAVVGFQLGDTPLQCGDFAAGALKRDFMTGKNLVLFAELALQLADGFAQIALDVDGWTLLQLPLFVREIGAQGRQLGFILFANSRIFIGRRGLRLLEVEIHQTRLRQKDVDLVEQENCRIAFLMIRCVHI